MAYKLASAAAASAAQVLRDSTDVETLGMVVSRLKMGPGILGCVSLLSEMAPSKASPFA